MATYPTLIGEIAKRGIRKSVIAKQIGISERALYNKLDGITRFSWDEVCAISETFFPDMDKSVLFAREDRPA